MNNGRPDLNLLVVFDAVAATRSVSAAAKRLSLSQPAVSHALNRLRDLLGDRLFVRNRSGLVPTPKAERMTGPIRDLVAAANHVVLQSTFDPATDPRTFRIAVTDYANLTILPSLVRAFRAEAPAMTLGVLPLGADVSGDLETGTIDFALGVNPEPREPLLSKVLFRDRLVGVCAPTHPITRRSPGTPVGLEDYLDQPHVLVTTNSAHLGPVDAALRQLGRERHIAVRTQSFRANLAALEESDLVSAIPERILRSGLAEGLAAFELPLDLEPFDYRLVWHRRSDADPGSIWLRDLLTRAIADRPETV